MANKTLSKKEDIIGLDIGSSSVKMARFTRKEDGLYLVAVNIRDIEKTDDSAVYEREVLSVLKEFFADPILKKSRIIVNINCSQTSIKNITAPQMPPDELREAIKFSAKSQFSFSIDDSLLDFEIIGDVVDKGVKKYEILVAACPKKTSDRYIALLDKAGIRPSSFISTSYALQKIAGHMRAKDQKTICYIDIGDSCTEMVISKGKHLLFTRKIPIAGNDLTKALMGTLVSDRGKINLSQNEAERIKRGVGMPSEAGPKLYENKITATQILSLLRSPVEQLVSEIERCFGYYRELGLGEEIDSVVLFGGSASLGGLVKFMSEALEVEVGLGDCLQDIKVENDAMRENSDMRHRFELVVGAALSGTEGIDLLPSSIKRRELAVSMRKTLTVIAVTVVGASLVLYLSMMGQSKTLDRKLAAARSELSGLELQLKKADMKILASRILVNEPRWEEIFAELGNLLPRGVYLKGLSMRNNILTLRGIVESEDAERVLADMIFILEKGMFSGVKLISTRKLDSGAGSEFELRCWIDYK